MVSEQDSLGFLLADLSRMMRQAFQRRLEVSSITLAQARALVYLARHQGIRQIDLARLLEVQPITLARLIDQLAEAGLVERHADAADRGAYRMFEVGCRNGGALWVSCGRLGGDPDRSQWNHAGAHRSGCRTG